MVSEGAASTGVAPLDAALDGLYWGDNVVWETEAEDALAPYYAAIGTMYSDKVKVLRDYTWIFAGMIPGALVLGFAFRKLGSGLVLGYHGHGTRHIVDVAACSILTPGLAAALSARMLKAWA